MAARGTDACPRARHGCRSGWGRCWRRQPTPARSLATMRLAGRWEEEPPRGGGKRMHRWNGSREEDDVTRTRAVGALTGKTPPTLGVTRRRCSQRCAGTHGRTPPSPKAKCALARERPSLKNLFAWFTYVHTCSTIFVSDLRPCSCCLHACARCTGTIFIYIYIYARFGIRWLCLRVAHCANTTSMVSSSAALSSKHVVTR